MIRFFKHQLIQFQCARISKIPLCCIMWWMIAYQWLVRDFGKTEYIPEEKKSRRRAIAEIYLKKIDLSKKDYRYIPCPLCLLRKKKAEILICDCEKDYKTCGIIA